MKQIKTCFIIKITQVRDCGQMRGKLERVIELSGHKKAVLIPHEDEFEIVLKKYTADKAIDLVTCINYLIPEVYAEIFEL